MINTLNKFLPEFIGESIYPIFKEFEENLYVGLYILQRGRFRHVNENASRILGYDDPTDLVGRVMWSLVHPKDRKLVKLAQSSHKTMHSPVNPFRMFRQDGHTVWVAMQGANTTFGGKPANAGYLIDLTSIRYLKRSLNKYRARITQVQDGITEVDPKGTIVSYTEATRKLWALSGDENIGKNYRDIMNPVAADILRQAYQQVYKTGLPANSVIYEFTRKDGQRKVVEDSVSLVRDEDGKPAGFRAVSRDITEQKQKEQISIEQQARLEAIFRSVNDAIITVDPELNIIKANAAAQSICGFDAENTTGNPLPEKLGRCCASCVDVLRQTLEDHKAVKDIRIECRHEQRRRQIVDVSSSALLDADKKFMGAVLVIRDMTQLQDIERELQPRRQYRGIIGKSRRMQDIFHLLEDLADLQTTVLITGESGTGKNMIAKALHQSGLRSNSPFVTVNCSVLPESLLESELFGHAKGAFTGAIQDKVGRFEAADGGTLVIDEIADVSQLIQLKLLRVLQEREFERVGESRSRRVDVRVIACTNTDLKHQVKRGEYREDLYYRLKVVEIYIPPLRERIEDIPLLVEHFCNVFNQRFGKKIQGLTEDAIARFMDYHWPGNVRELEHAIEHAFVHCEDRLIKMAHLPPEIRTFGPAPPKAPSEDELQRKNSSQEILTALSKTYWNKSKTAQMLGISRQTLYRRMKKYRLLTDDGP